MSPLTRGRLLRTFLLGLPRIEGRHSGENLAHRVSEIIHEYGIEEHIGYFVTDNADSNGTCLEDLGIELGFKKQHRRLRCCGHIINLVARSILFGTDADAFEEDCQADKEIQDEVKLWRSKGPIGKLHNIVHGVQRSGQRIEKLHKLQSIENTALSLEDKTTYDVIPDNATRWNSSEAMMERGYLLRNALDSLVQAEVTEWNQYVARRTQNGTKPMPKKSRKKPAIVDDKMATEDWSVIAEYLAILKPLKIATKRLEGRPQEGKFGAIWEVLLTMEWLLKHLEEAKVRHERDEEPYLRIGCNLGWMKLDQYYTLTEDSPAYLAALVLHPAFRWSTVESQWADHPDWLVRGKAAVQELWEEYRNLPVEQDTIPEQPTVARKTTGLDDFMASIRKLSTQPAPSTSAMLDEYAEWVATTDPGDCLVDDPIQYWLLRRRQYPRLSRMAINLFSVPAMSSEPERIFSLAGQMVTAQRGRLKADLIGAARLQKKDSDVYTEGSGSEDGLDVPERVHDEDYCPSPPKVQGSGSEDDDFDDEEHHDRKRRKVSRSPPCSIRNAATSARDSRRRRRSTRAVAHSLRERGTSALGVLSPAPSQATSVPSEASAFLARFQEWPLENVSTKRTKMARLRFNSSLSGPFAQMIHMPPV
ncbi:hypothetical protein MRS44_017561 [Fusarium solani]|uniref:uncharacterized protein n=1 Tax=Fusarium solani TaxID=169388 RepID=UPI0032C3E29C|nr:hypothetical protein MRS44_017561 [Fusarium solani]